MTEGGLPLVIFNSKVKKNDLLCYKRFQDKNGSDINKINKTKACSNPHFVKWERLVSFTCKITWMPAATKQV